MALLSHSQWSLIVFVLGALMAGGVLNSQAAEFKTVVFELPIQQMEKQANDTLSLAVNYEKSEEAEVDDDDGDDGQELDNDPFLMLAIEDLLKDLHSLAELRARSDGHHKPETFNAYEHKELQLYAQLAHCGDNQAEAPRRLCKALAAKLLETRTLEERK